MDSHKAGNAEGIAALDLRQLRCNPERHPMHAVNGKEWRDAWGSRLKGFWNPNHPNERFDEWQIPEHDDLDCLDDLEAAGLITVYSGANVFVGINEGRGMEVYVQLHKHKISGGMFANFEPQL